MFAEGSQPGYSPKAEYLKLNPSAVCKRRKHATHFAYVIYLTHDENEPILIRPTARDAWEAALMQYTKE